MALRRPAISTGSRSRRKQKIAAAQAEAESLRLQRRNITPDLVELRRIEAMQEAIRKWNGVMPSVTGGALPFIDANVYGESETVRAAGGSDRVRDPLRGPFRLPDAVVERDAAVGVVLFRISPGRCASRASIRSSTFP